MLFYSGPWTVLNQLCWFPLANKGFFTQCEAFSSKIWMTGNSKRNKTNKAQRTHTPNSWAAVKKKKKVIEVDCEKKKKSPGFNLHSYFDKTVTHKDISSFGRRRQPLSGGSLEN